MVGVGFTNLLCCDIPQNKALHTGPRHIWRTYTLCPFSGHEMNRDDSGVWWMILKASVGYGGSWVTQHLFQPHLVFQSIWEWGDLGFFQFIQSNSSPEGARNLGGYILPHKKITESNGWVLLDPEDGLTTLWSTWIYVDSSNSCWPCDQNCRHNPCAGCNIPQCEVSWGSRCHQKNFLLLVVGPCYSTCKLLVRSSKLMWSNVPWSTPLCHPFSISVVLVQRQRACLFCKAKLCHMNLFYVCPSHKKFLGWKEIVHKHFVS